MSTLRGFRFTDRERHQLFLAVRDRIVKLQLEGGVGNNWPLHTLFGLLERLSGPSEPEPPRDRADGDDQGEKHQQEHQS